MASTTKLLPLRRLSRALKPPKPFSTSSSSPSSSSTSIQRSSFYFFPYLLEASKCARRPSLSPPSRGFCSRPLDLEDEGPATIDYRSLLQEDEFHKLADSTIQDLLEKLEAMQLLALPLVKVLGVGVLVNDVAKFEFNKKQRQGIQFVDNGGWLNWMEYGDSIDIDAFDIDYGNHVLTLKLGTLGTYVLNKQTPNRQIWMSSPVSGPSRFDWDQEGHAWVYRRTKANLAKVLEDELQKLCGQPINLS